MEYTIKAPILGFEHIKRVKIEKIDDFFMKLESLDDDTTFTLINPFLLRNYDFEIPDYFKNLLEIDKNTNISVLNIMIIATPIETSTINFIAPIIFNTDKKIAGQILLDENRYKDYGIMESISSYLEKK